MINKFIGSGMVFPILLQDGKAIVYKDSELIRHSIMSIINWPKAHRFFNEEYGCRVFELIEEPNDDITKTLLKHFITDSIGKWEKRVKVNQSNIQIIRTEHDRLDVSITYQIIATKTEETFIFPFYKEIIY